MRKTKLPDSRTGAVIIAFALAVSVASSMLLAWILYGVNSQKNLQRRNSLQYPYNVIMDQVTTRSLNDLRLAAHYPDYIGLPNPPKSPIYAGSSIPCGKKDPNAGNKFTLDAYLVPSTTNCLRPHPGTYPYVTKQFTYPPGNFQTVTEQNLVIFPATAPVVTLTKKAGVESLYSLVIQFNGCNPPSLACAASNQYIIRYEGMINTDTPFFQN